MAVAAVLVAVGLTLAKDDLGNLFGDDDNFCVTRIKLISPTAADVDVLDFGASAKGDPKAIAESLVRIRL